MINLTIFNGANDQVITLTALADQAGNTLAGATITGSLIRSNVALPGGILTFVDAPEQPGDYSAPLTGFDAPVGVAQLQISGTAGGSVFKFTISCTVVRRSL